MILYHNADYKDLPSILKDGILPMSETGNNRWNNKKRADNSQNVVYLFNPIGKQNSFFQYGICLIEVDTDATEKHLMRTIIITGNTQNMLPSLFLLIRSRLSISLIYLWKGFLLNLIQKYLLKSHGVIFMPKKLTSILKLAFAKDTSLTRKFLMKDCQSSQKQQN